MYPRAVLKAMLGDAPLGVIPAELLTTERIMQRWAVANGSGLPSERWDDTRKAKLPPLDDDAAYTVDRIVLACPSRTRKIIQAWCYSPLPTSVIAKRIGMSPRSFEKSWLVALYFLKWRFEGSGHKTLLKLLRVHV